ncbi:AAA family ATPase [Spiribacter sp. C176]|uniref:Shikimate kinase n=1 Tax=Spiribacter salilacus TaxID=2664894 RepID=A0A6N7QYV3_9GAMM|nr:shikimate kinase [Spiribacter salilacus]MRH77834.1 AAA family ATPase [Spiribacter salilacus]
MNTAEKTNVVLIGMPGAGKSTVGVLLARRLGKGFIDTDLLIQARAGQTLQDIVDREGHTALRELEAEVLTALHCHDQVIATGGSAVYSAKAMAALGSNGIIVHLHVPMAVILKRVTDFDTRGIARAANQTLEDLYEEREQLYQHYADISVAVGETDQEGAVTAVLAALA